MKVSSFHFAACTCAALTLSALLPQVAAAKVWDQPQHGKLPLKSADVLAFAPDGILLIGDGPCAAIFAVQTTPPETAGKLMSPI